MANALNFFKTYLLPQAIATGNDAVGVYKMAPGVRKHYRNAIMDMVSKIKKPVRWYPEGYIDQFIDMKKVTKEQIDNHLLGRGLLDSEEIYVKPIGLGGDIIMDPFERQLSKTHAIVGTRGQSTPPALLHELGHIQSVEKSPIVSYLRTLNEGSPHFADVAHLGGKGSKLFNQDLLYNLSKSPTVFDEIKATRNAYRALSNTNAPAPVKRDLLLRVMPGLGTYMLPIRF